MAGEVNDTEMSGKARIEENGPRPPVSGQTIDAYKNSNYMDTKINSSFINRTIPTDGDNRNELKMPDVENVDHS